jgi:hypothetical protein
LTFVCSKRAGFQRALLFRELANRALEQASSGAATLNNGECGSGFGERRHCRRLHTDWGNVEKPLICLQQAIAKDFNLDGVGILYAPGD